MANVFNVNDEVVCQKKGGQTGNKPLTPAFQGTVVEVLAGGTEYRVKMKPSRLSGTSTMYFKDNIVAEEHMTAV